VPWPFRDLFNALFRAHSVSASTRTTTRYLFARLHALRRSQSDILLLSQTYNNPRVSLVSIKGNPIKTVGGKDGMITLSDGTSYGPFDAIITAIGFDAMTGSLEKIDITGRNGLKLKKAWEAGPSTYLGLFIHGWLDRVARHLDRRTNANLI
jgi:hypothetical protein